MQVTPDGGIQFPDVTPEQSVEMEAANDLCAQKYPVDPRYRQPLTEHSWGFSMTGFSPN